MQVNNIFSKKDKLASALCKQKNKENTWLRFFVLFMFGGLIIFSGCIEEFNPIVDDYAALLVVDGSIIKEEKIQKVVISKSSHINEPSFIPMEFCTVSVIDNLGNKFMYTENKAGVYEASIPEEYLAYGKSFQLNITTPKGETYKSDFETILYSSPIDSVYFEEGTFQSSSQQHKEGLQFYADLKASEFATRYYRWKLTESYEYHSRYEIEAIWDNKVNKVIELEELDTSLQVCWREDVINAFYSANTDNLNTNKKKRVLLHFVPKESRKLAQKYCLLVKQYSLSGAAYKYWGKHKVENQESGGLYQAQPSQSISNIHNINNPEEKVLGYFWATSYSEKIMFVKSPDDWSYFFLACNGSRVDPKKEEELRLLQKQQYLTNASNLQIIIPDSLNLDLINNPTFSDSVRVANYISIQMSYKWAHTDQRCFDCTLLGGKTEKPDYWE